MHLRLGSKPGLKRIFTCLVMPAVLFILFWVVHPGTAGAGNALEVKAAGYSAVSVTQTMTTANPVLSPLPLSGNPITMKTSTSLLLNSPWPVRTSMGLPMTSPARKSPGQSDPVRPRSPAVP